MNPHDDPDRKSDDDTPLVDPALDAAWRAQSDELPSAALDASILAVAHRTVGARPQAVDDALAEAREPERWWWPLAAAAVIGTIAVGVLQLTSRSPDTMDAIVSDTPRSAAPVPPPMTPPAAPTVATGAPAAPVAVPAPPIAPPSAPAPVPAARKPSSAASQTAPERESSRTSPEKLTQPAPPPTFAVPRSAPAPVPTPFPAEAPAESPKPSPPAQRFEAASPTPEPPTQGAAQDRATGKLEMRERAAPMAGAAQAPSRPLADPAIALRSGAATADAAPRVDREALPRTPEEWIARLRELRRDGRETEAQAALNAFRNAFTDADDRLPADLRAWAATVRR